VIRIRLKSLTDVIPEETRLETCTPWSSLTFQRCSSHHFKWVIVALSLEATVEQQCGPTMALDRRCTIMRCHCRAIMCYNNDHGLIGCLPLRKNMTDRQTDTHTYIHTWMGPYSVLQSCQSVQNT
jgi:hypothetical protein